MQKHLKNNIIRSVLALVLSITICTSLCSCEILLAHLTTLDIENNGIAYVISQSNCTVDKINDSRNSPEMKALVIPDYLNGCEVDALGTWGWVTPRTVSIKCSITERLYIPWTISHCYPFHFFSDSSEENALKYFISASNGALVSVDDMDLFEGYCVITRCLYDKYYDGNNESYLPANISFMFNHAENPNQGYFFIDLVEESGTISKPPYDPRREGYIFLGWYKDEACEQAWDFENDTVEILFDEEGNRIYEEIKLYAGWEEQEDYGADLSAPYNIAFILNYEDAPNDGYFFTYKTRLTGKIEEPDEPKRIGYSFDGWYKDPECTIKLDFKTERIQIRYENGKPIKEVLMIYAKWEKS